MAKVIGVKELAAQLNTEPKDLRRLLRKNFGKATGRTYQWKATDPQIAKIKALFKAGTAPVAKPKLAELKAKKRALIAEYKNLEPSSGAYAIIQSNIDKVQAEIDKFGIVPGGSIGMPVAIAPIMAEKNMNHFSYLYGRWQDEKEYEDFSDYAKQMKTLVEKPNTFVKATKSPFGFIVNTPVGQVHITASKQYMGWKYLGKTTKGGK